MTYTNTIANANHIVFMQTSQTYKSELIMLFAQIICRDLPCKDLILYVLKKQPANVRRTDRKFNEPTDNFDEPTESRTDRFSKIYEPTDFRNEPTDFLANRPIQRSV